MEEQLLQSRAALQQLEAELHALHKSCLLQLARSSWVGRVLRSSTGSVEVSLCVSVRAAHPCPLPIPPWTSLTASMPGTGRMEPQALPTWHSAGVCLRCG